MIKINSKKFTLIFVLISSVSLSIIYISIIMPLYNYDSDRIYNLRAVPERYRVSLLEHFIDKRYIENSILILGDSQSNGYGHKTKDVFSTLLSIKSKKRVINTAFPDKSITDNIYTLKHMIKQEFKFNTIIFNVNHSHPRMRDHYRLNLTNSVDYKIGILKNSNTFWEFSSKFNPITSRTGFYQYPSLPEYFDMPLDNFKIYMDRVERIIILAKSISKHVVIYETPHAIKEIKRLDLNVKDMNMLSIGTENLCSKHGVFFLKPQISKIKYFNDIVHFSKKGHVKMTEILYETINNL